MQLLERLSVRKRLFIAGFASLLGIALIVVYSLVGLRDDAMEAHRQRVQDIVEVSSSIVKHYRQLETDGKLPTAEAQALAKADLASLRYDKTDYVFVYDFDTIALAVPDATMLGQSMRGKTDAAGYKLWDEMAALAAGPGSGYLSYVFPRAGETEAKPKLSYILAIPEWRWIVGTGVYVDDVDTAVRAAFLRYLLIAFVIAGAIGIASIVVARSIIRQLGGEPADLVTIMGRAAAGDLRTDAKTNAAAGSVVASLDGMLHGLSVLVSDISSASREITARAKEVATTSQQISDATVQQSDATSTMASGMEEMTVAVNHIADNAKLTETESLHAAEIGIAGETRAIATVETIKGIAATVEDAGTKVSGLVQRADEIGTITNVIKSIATQTNLLALNAAIEAARAGEQGRGFAVVADEVRVLAERTAQATVQIEQMIAAIQTDTRNVVSVMAAAAPQANIGVESTNAGAESLRELREAAENTLDRIRTVADATREQGLASNSIAQQVEKIAQMVEETSASVGSAADAAAALEQLATDLQKKVSRFIV